jgi:curved DNA-binding protein CbpA
MLGRTPAACPRRRRMTDPYEVLQVRADADHEVIQAAYRALARKHHPDRGGDPGEMARLNEAWAVLSDPRRRATHDALRHPHSAGRAEAHAPVARARAARAQAQARGHHAQAPSTAAPAYSPGGRTTGEPGGAAGETPTTPSGAGAPGGAAGTMLDFGRYAGWAIWQVAAHDPDYLLWLARTPIGRAYRAEIDRTLAEHARRPAPASRKAGPSIRRRFAGAF